MGKKAKKVDTKPNEQAIAMSQEQLQLGRDQLDFFKQQWEGDVALQDQIMGVLMPQMYNEAMSAADDRERYISKFQPVEDQMMKDAQEYSSVGRQEKEAAKASASVAINAKAARDQAASRLEAYGVDPSQTRAGALDRSLMADTAAAQAGAANAARDQTEAIGRGLRGDVVNLGKGYASQIASAAQTAAGAAGQGLQGQLAVTGSAGQTMGTAPQYFSGAQQGLLGAQQNAISASQVNNSRGDSFWSTVGSVAGVGLGLAI